MQIITFCGSLMIAMCLQEFSLDTKAKPNMITQNKREREPSEGHRVKRYEKIYIQHARSKRYGNEIR